MSRTRLDVVIVDVHRPSCIVSGSYAGNSFLFVREWMCSSEDYRGGFCADSCNVRFNCGFLAYLAGTNWLSYNFFLCR